MSIPTTNLYDFIHQVLENEYWMKYFYPWGSRNLLDVKDRLDCNGKENYQKIVQDYQGKIFLNQLLPDISTDDFNFLNFQPVLFCHDQEPLNWDLYTDNNIPDELKQRWNTDVVPENINLNLRHTQPESFRQHWILLHSELNSKQVELYESTNQYACAYWWSHAVISRDWYRFAQYDNRLNHQRTEKLFLIYARDATGSREYRKTLIEQIKNNCEDFQLGSFDSDTVITSDSSAEYNAKDHAQTGISIVCETVFDDRIHLTEKTCRALACKHPFILAAGPGSLKYLKTYGFKTFTPWIDESYDSIQDSQQRLNAIIKEMQRIESDKDRHIIIENCRAIAEYNQKIFFSELFFQQVVQELKTNVYNASCKSNQVLSWQKLWYVYKQLPKSERVRKQRPYFLTLIRHLKKGGTLKNYVPPDLD